MTPSEVSDHGGGISEDWAQQQRDEAWSRVVRKAPTDPLTFRNTHHEEEWAGPMVARPRGLTVLSVSNDLMATLDPGKDYGQPNLNPDDLEKGWKGPSVFRLGSTVHSKKFI